MSRKRFLFCIILAIFNISLFAQQLPDGYGDVHLGMSLKETKEQLLKNPDFGYSGDRDVSLLPGDARTLIETNATGTTTTPAQKDAHTDPLSEFRRLWAGDFREIPIPEEIRSFYRMYRPSPLVRAYCLEEKLQTPAKIYYKFEGNNTSGSHKLNSAIAQAYYAKKQGLKGVTTETGAGQWGTALSMACAYLGLDCKVFMVKVSYEQSPSAAR